MSYAIERVLVVRPKPARRGPKARKRIDRKQRPRVRRKSSVAALKRKLWALFAAAVKARDGAVCFTCGRFPLEGRNWQAGHFIRQDGHAAVEFDPHNVHSQCGHCNLYQRGNVSEHALHIIDLYGADEFRRLVNRQRMHHTWHEWELRDLIGAIEKSLAEYERLYYERYL